MSLTTRVRTTVAAGPLVARRRAATDAGLLVLSGVLAAALVLVALLAPRLVMAVADSGARSAVERGRPSTDVIARTNPPTAVVLGARPSGSADDLRRDAATIADGMPAELRSDLTDPTTTTVVAAWNAQVPAGVASGRLGHVLTADGSDPVRWVAGREPAGLPEVVQAEGQSVADLERYVEVGVSVTAAEALGLEPGDEVVVQGTLVSRLTARVVGTYEAVDPDDPMWTGLQDFVEARPAPAGTGSVAAAGFLVSDDALPDLLVAFAATGVTTDVRFLTLPDRLTAERAATIAARVAELRADPLPLQLMDARVPLLETRLDQTLLTYRERLSGATAQASVLLAGIVAVGGLTLLLAARLLVERRASLYTLERARGASVASVGWRALLESVPLTTLACAVAVGLLAVLVPRADGAWWPGAVVAAVGVLAPAVLAGSLVRRSWTGRRVPANRADRDRLASRRRARRLVGELTLLVVAGGALASVRARGLLASSTGGVDWLLAATPVLLAGASTVLVARVLPPVLRASRRAASRGPALAGLVATARAERASRTAIPLLTVTVAVALVVFSGLTVATVDRGQQRAADLVVGGDVRIDGPVDDAAIDALRQAPGVTSVVGTRVWLSRSFGVSSGVDATLIAVDAGALAEQRDREGAPQPELTSLVDAGGDRVPALVSPELERVAEQYDPQVWTTDTFVPVDVRGTTAMRDEDGRPVVVVDRQALAAALGAEVPALRTQLVGPGASAAVDELGVSTSPGVTTLGRAEWLEEWTTSPLTSGLRTLMAVSQVALAGLAVVALVLTVVATARDRSRTLHVLRTLGLDAGTARRLSAGEVLPLLVAGLVAGSAIGFVVPWLLTSALGLSALTGEPDGTRLAIAWQPVAIAAGALLVGLAVAVEVEARVRRDDDLAVGIREAER
ncbi:FtsX-like permease family protein [Cellulomonas persica]|uniref:Membrane protein n=1 Tax=Cellulomonas persica TaxID=76861 RepID=A0A510UZ01_9CELL|nr:FtsX-like permease family protein [Cellulomonas persica]GEK18045.1 membrane protein [Cellulomonas persica]